jgi:hypothetical protein
MPQFTEYWRKKSDGERFSQAMNGRFLCFAMSHPYELNILLQSLRAGNITFMQFLVQAKAWVSQQLGKATDRLITQADG